jgi:AcrR family transcriptional regulator
MPGLRERKKGRLRQQIIDTSIRLFRKRGYYRAAALPSQSLLKRGKPKF